MQPWKVTGYLQMASGIRYLTHRDGGRAAQAGGIREVVYWPWLGRLLGDVSSIGPL